MSAEKLRVTPEESLLAKLWLDAARVAASAQLLLFQIFALPKAAPLLRWTAPSQMANLHTGSTAASDPTHLLSSLLQEV